MHRLTAADIAGLVGTQNAGYTIVKARNKDTHPSPYGIALARNERDLHVTWQFHMDEGDKGASFYWGHYHMENAEAAELDYANRD